MGRPPQSGVTVFRFTQAEVAEMEACLREANYAIPARDTIGGLAEKFSASTERAGRSNVQTKQVWNWFQNRRYSQRAKMTKAPLRPSVSPFSREEIVPPRNSINSLPVARGRKPSSDTNHMEFEARSDRDRAWYDVADFMTHRMLESGDPEVLIRFTGFGIEEDEWVNVRRCVRLRSLPCEPSECVVVLPGDLVLCFQEGKDQALYFDAHVLDAQRRRHDVRGCRCRFLVRYDHDNSEEIVPLRKICRRPETDYRLKILQESKSLVPGDPRIKDSSYVGPSQKSSVLEAPKLKKLQKLTDPNARATPSISLPEERETADAAALGMAQYKNTAVLAIPAITGGGFNENIKKEI